MSPSAFLFAGVLQLKDRPCGVKSRPSQQRNQKPRRFGRSQMPAFVIRVRHKLRQSIEHRGKAATLARALLAPYYLLREYLRARRSFDGRHGVDTDPTPISGQRGSDWTEWVIRGGGYAPVSPEYFVSALEKVNISYSDFTFIDLGSGKGRALLLASEFPFREIIGVELGPELHTIAKQNIRNYKTPTQKCKQFKLVCADFTSFPLPVGNLFLYFFNPCHEPEMRKLVAHIRMSLQTDPREVYILYINPLLSRVIEEANFVQKITAGPRYLVYKNVA